MAELGNLTGRILLSPRRMSTVKIRARSLFRTPVSRIGAEGAGSGVEIPVEKRSSIHACEQNAGRVRFSSALHNLGRTFTGCTQAPAVSHLQEARVRVQSQLIQFKKTESRRWT